MSLPLNYLFQEVTLESVATRTRVAVELALRPYRDVPEVVWGRFLDRAYWGVFHDETIYLAAHLGAREAAETALHELRHAEQSRSPAWGRATMKERETDAEAWAREALVPLKRSILPSLGPDELERLVCARSSEPSYATELEAAFADLREWRRSPVSFQTSHSRPPRAERFRGAAPRWECYRASWGQNAVDLETGTFRGVASVFGSVVDAFPPTIVEPGAFTRTLQNDASRVRILYQHQVDEPIGRPLSMTETDLGLEVVGKISMTEKGKECLQLMSDGVLNELSIGFDPVRWWNDGDGVRHLTEVRLWEFSPVTFAADRNARVTEVHA